MSPWSLLNLRRSFTISISLLLAAGFLVGGNVAGGDAHAAPPAKAAAGLGSGGAPLGIAVPAKMPGTPGALLPPAGVSAKAAAAVPATSPVVTSVTRTEGTLDVFGVDAGRRIWAAAWAPDHTDGWHRVSQLNGGLAAPGTSVFGASYYPGHVDVFAVGTDRRVYTAAASPASGAAWGGWWRIGDLVVEPNTSVHVVSKRRDHMDIFAVGDDRRVWTAEWDRSWGWLPWERLGDMLVAPNTTVYGASRGRNKIDIFTADQFRHPVTNSIQPGAGWKGWRTFEDSLYIAGGSSIFPVSRGPDLLDVFTVNHIGSVMTTAWDPNIGDGLWPRAWRIGTLTTAGGTVFGTSRARNFLDIVAVGNDRSVYTAAWEPSFGADWHGWWQIGTGGVAASTSVFVNSKAPNHLDVFAVSSTLGAYTAAWEPGDTAFRGWWEIGFTGAPGERFDISTTIDFNGGVTVDGWARLRAARDGTWTFSGHFHDSGALSYDVGIVWVIAIPGSTAFTFSAKGKVHGLFEGGSRNYDWNVSGASSQLEARWDEIMSTGTWNWRAETSLNVGSILENLLTAGIYAMGIDSVIQIV
jgi:hypothetical protein